MQTSRLLTALSANAFGTGAYTPAAFDVRVGRPVVVIAFTESSANDAHQGSDLTISDTGGNTWIPLVTSTTHPNWGMGIRAWGVNPKADANIQVSVDAGAFGIDNYAVIADELIGPRRIRLGATGVGSDADGDAAASVTLSAATQPGSLVYGLANRANGTGAAGTITAGAEWTEVYQTSRVDWWVFQAQVRAGGFGTTVPWTDLSVGGVPVGATLASFELLDEPLGAPALDLVAVAHWKPKRWDYSLANEWLFDDFSSPSTGQNIAVGLVTSTNTAFSVGKRKSKALGLASSTNTALTCRPRRLKVVGLASSTNSALTVARRKTKTLGLCSSANTALAVVAPKNIAVGLATSTNTAFAVAHTKRKGLGLCTSTNTALPVATAPLAGGGMPWLPQWIRRRLFD